MNPDFLFELDGNQAGNPGRSGFIQGTLPDQDVRQISARVLDPSLKSADELHAINEPALKCEQSEQEVVGFIGSSGHREKPHAKAQSSVQEKRWSIV